MSRDGIERKSDTLRLCLTRLSFHFSLFLSRGADIDIVNKEGDTPLSLARPDTPVWVALQINRKLRRGIANRVVRTERIICRSVSEIFVKKIIMS